MIFPFIERARRRYIWNEVLAQSAFAAALLFGGLTLLLLLGTQLLDWRWVLALVAIGICVGVQRVARRMPTHYRVAVLVDARAGLNDALSTALHFSDHRQGKAGLPAIREFQKQQAERLIPAVDLNSALPFHVPRAIYIVGLLGVVAGGLFALRYGIRHTLDLRAPMTQVVMDGFGLHAPEDKLAASVRKKNGSDPKRIDALDEQGMPLPRSEQKRAGEPDAATAASLDTVNDPNVNNEKAQSASAGKEGNAKGAGEGKEGDAKSPSEQAENGKPAAGKNTADSAANGREGPQQGEPGAGQQGSQSNSSSLLSKMKDAVQNLMSKAMPQQNGAGQKPNGAQGQQKGQSQQAKAGEKGTPGDSKDGGQQEAEGQQGQQAGDQDNSDNGQGKGNGKSSEQQAAAQPGSGIGKQDGAKDIKAAEQKAAMGKLSEIIGKRSANVSGEMMVESQSGPQQLRTQYSRRNAVHGETGGEVNRDEVPVELQGYVQQYFEQVRKHERTVTQTPATKVK